MEKVKIFDAVKIGSWEEVSNIPASTITKNDKDTQKLDGLILRGYETKFKDAKNFNSEVYETGCLDKFIENYFVKNNLNMPVTIFDVITDKLYIVENEANNSFLQQIYTFDEECDHDDNIDCLNNALMAYILVFGELKTLF